MQSMGQVLGVVSARVLANVVFMLGGMVHRVRTFVSSAHHLLRRAVLD
ncbi:hypothetical protein LX88_005811 [Lentzea californiensis]|nr:hypothetical protein [Lentzea californiensis]